MKKNKSKEIDRRVDPRIYHELPLYIAANGYDFKTTTQNISCSGAYCQIKKYIPPFTKLAIKMTLPIKKNNKKEKIDIKCKGVIVRSDDTTKNGFNIAIFFNEISENQREKIAQYIHQYLPEKIC
ncbi:MAG: PilZ domain-containing protein [Candidatus Omnitrophota bacterium]